MGLSLKAMDKASKSLLFELLGALERMKNELGANDAIDNEAVSAAYVENFALRVFALADNEDRKGGTNR
jgi:vacuolar protein sorting-associated protein VTA1